MNNDRDIKFDIVIGHHGKKERRIIIIITRYDYNLTIMKSPKLATDNRFKK
jgi:hypothetical protein